MTAPALRQVIVVVDAPDRLITTNTAQNLHHHQRAKIVREWRRTAYARGCFAKRCSMPVQAFGPLGKVHVVMTVELPESGEGSRIRDIGGLAYPVGKAILDGIVDSGLIFDDSDKYVIGPDLRRADTRLPVARFTVTLTEVEEGQ